MSATADIRAFTLIELSIVLVIIGLIIGGVLVGRDLIRAAEVRSVIAEYTKYSTAVNAFRERYSALPGDITNATTFWGAEPVSRCPGDETTPSTTSATCDGNGDEAISWGGAPGRGGEAHRFWQHLSNAGFIEGKYSGTHSAGGCNLDGSCNVTLGVNSPRSRIRNAGWSVAYIGGIDAGHPYYFQGPYINVLYFGNVSNWTSSAAFTPSEAWNIDTKLDDGKPGTGLLRTWNPSFDGGCADSNAASTAQYSLGISEIRCALIFRTAP